MTSGTKRPTFCDRSSPPGEAARGGRESLTLRILLWNLADSKTTLAELRERLPELPEGDVWISDEASERFGLISLSDEPMELDEIRALIGKEPDLGEEFDVE